MAEEEIITYWRFDGFIIRAKGLLLLCCRRALLLLKHAQCISLQILGACSFLGLAFLFLELHNKITQLEEIKDIYQLMPYLFLVNGIVDFGGSQFVLQIIQPEVLQNSNWIEIEVRNVRQFGVWTFSHSSCRLVFRWCKLVAYLTIASSIFCCTKAWNAVLSSSLTNSRSALFKSSTERICSFWKSKDGMIKRTELFISMHRPSSCNYMSSNGMVDVQCETSWLVLERIRRNISTKLLSAISASIVSSFRSFGQSSSETLPLSTMYRKKVSSIDHITQRLNQSNKIDLLIK